MDLFICLRNRLRHRLGRSMVGRALLQARPGPPLTRICVVSATRRTERDFWRHAALGRSLAPWLKHPDVSVDIRYQNAEGLPQIYNTALKNPDSAEVLIFVHDDIWFDDSNWLSKVRAGLHRYDMIGVAGNTRRSRHQPAWLFSHEEGGQLQWDSAYLSGGICHGEQAHGHYSHYGHAPADCLLLDGVFLAVRAEILRRSRVFFDERFDFDFYDMDFCRRAQEMGLAMGTWPITLTHQSAGAFGGTSWETNKQRYFDKWKG